MSSFRVDTSAFDSNIPKIPKIKNRMGAIQQEMSSIASRLSWEIKGQQQLDRKLSQLQSEFDTLKGSLSKMEDCLVKVRDEYIHAQNDAKKEVNGLSGSILGKTLISTFTAIGTGIAKMLGIAPDNCQYAGDPVNVTTGSFYVNEKDLEIQDLSGAIKIERKYTSISKRSGLLGPGWSIDLESRLYLEGNTITVLCPDGHTESYDRDGDSWRNTKGESLAFVLSYDADKGQWIMSDTLQKKKYIYDAKGLLI